MSRTRKSTNMRKEIDFDDLCTGKAEQGYSFNLTSLEGVTSKDEAVEKIEKHITQTLSAVQDGKTIDSETIYIGKTSTKKIKDQDFDPMDKNTISKDPISRRLQAHIKEGRDVMVAVTVVTQEIAKSMGFKNVTTDSDTEEAPTCATFTCALEIEEKVSKKYPQQKHNCYEDYKVKDAEAYLLYVAFKYLVTRHPTKSYNKRNIHSLNIAEPSSGKTVNADTANTKVGDGSTNVDRSRTITPKIESGKKRQRVHSTSPTLQTKKQKSKCSAKFNSINSGDEINSTSEEMNKANLQSEGRSEEIHHVPFIGPTEVLKCDYNGIENYTLKDHGITIKIPKGAIPKGKVVHIELAVTLCGPFSFPNNTRPISPILWMCPQEKIEFKQPFEVTLPHILTRLNQKELAELGVGFAKADHDFSVPKNGKSVVFDFKPCNIQNQEHKQGYSTLKSTHCCYLCLTANDEDKRKLQEAVAREEFLFSRYDYVTESSTFTTTFCVSYGLLTCEKALEEQFPSTSLVDKRSLPFKFKDRDNSRQERHLEIEFGDAEYPRYYRADEFPMHRKIKMSDVNFWTKNYNHYEMLVKHKRNLYPPRVTVNWKHRGHGYGECTIPVTVRGCAEDGELDHKILLPLGKREVIPAAKWNLQTFHSNGITGTGVVIAILDGGVDIKHDLIDESKIYHPPNSTDTYFTANYVPSQHNLYTQHGTSVAAVAGCLRYSDTTPAGIAPGAQLVVCRVSDSLESYHVEAIRNALTQLRDLKRSGGQIDIICMPFRIIDCDEGIEELLSDLAREKVICVAASGNDGRAQLGAHFPASDPHVLSVGALTPGALVSPLSADIAVDVYTYGENITLPVIDTPNQTCLNDGTSFAAPMVTGFLALLLQCVKDSFPTGTPVTENIVNKYHDINFLRKLFTHLYLCENRKLIRVDEFFQRFIRLRQGVPVDQHPAIEIIKQYYPNFNPYT